MGVLIGGRGNQDLAETKHEANNLHKMFHYNVLRVWIVNRIVKNVHFLDYVVRIYHTLSLTPKVAKIGLNDKKLRILLTI